MEHIIMGLLFAIGWQVVKVFFDIARELLFARLHKTNWYLIVAGERSKDIKDKPGRIKEVKNRIGF